MRFVSLFSYASLVLSVSAYGNVGTYERLWFWYAYQLDNAGSTIAPKCASTMGAGAGGRCSFVQFMNYIEQGSGDSINPSKLNNIDPNDIPAATKALGDGGYTGTYDCTHVYQGLPGVENQTPAKDNVAGLFQKLGYFCQGKVAGASADVQTNMQRVTTAVSRGRQGNAFAAYQKEMAARSPPINLVIGSTPMYDGAPTGDDFQTQTLNVGQSATNNGITRDQLRADIAEIQKADGAGHTSNAKTSKLAAQQVSLVCG